MLPLVHDFEGERVLVFGGGAVGARKAQYFGREAAVVVVSPEFVEDAFGGAELVRAAPSPSEASEWIARVDPILVVAATNKSELNAAIEAAASERNVLCNRADRAGQREAHSVVVPATIRDGPVVVSVSSGANSPALSRYLRDEIGSVIDGTGDMAALTASLRDEFDDEARRREGLQAVLGSEKVWKALDTKSANSRQVAITVIEDVTGDLG